MMALGANVVSEELAMELADIWLTTEFSGDERHMRRIALVMDLEK